MLIDKSFFFFLLIIFLFLFIGLYIVLANNPIHSILGLILIFFLAACLSISLGVEFLALVILIIYVGAISVLFLFIIMLLNIRVLEYNLSLVKYWWLGALYSISFLTNLYFCLFLILRLILDIEKFNFYTDFSNQLNSWVDTLQLSELLFSFYPHLFIFSALILLIAVVSPVVLSFIKFDKDSSVIARKKKNIFLQVVRESFDKET